MTPPIVAVFGSSQAVRNDPSFTDGIRLGRLLAEMGLTVATGGYAGLMEAVSEGARSGGAHVIGVTAPAVFPDRPGANDHVGEEIAADTLSHRIHRIVEMSDAAIALPGSLGTFTELMVAWNEAFVAPFSRSTSRPVIAVGPVWRELVELLAEKIGADASFVTCVATIDEACQAVREHLGMEAAR